MHFKRIENIFKLKKIAWAENDCLCWMLLCNPLGVWELSQGDRSRNNSFIRKSAGGGGEEQVIFLMISVNVLLPRTTHRTSQDGCRGAGGSQPMENPRVVSPLSAGRISWEATRPTPFHPASDCTSGLGAQEAIFAPSRHTAPAAVRSALPLLLTEESRPWAIP